jgi:hypothetical protein
MIMYQAYIRYLSIVPALFLLGACDSDSNNNIPAPPTPVPPSTQTYEVSISNLSYSQPLSPVAVIIHDSSYSGWTLGGPASNGLEQLAEGGDNAEFLASSEIDSIAGGEGIIMPGVTETLEVTLDEMPEVQLTVATMLVNTNDAFIGITGSDLTGLDVGESQMFELPVYDAGTEANMELMGTIPGPADGGAGYDATRDDVDYVARHPGVVGSAGGYSDSVLDESHRFDAPLALLTVTRVE